MKNFVIFGASGDLAFNYLYPSLFHLWQKGKKFKYIGFGRTTLTDKKYQQIIFESTKNKEFSKQFSYITGNYDEEGIEKLSKLTNSETIFYLAIPIRLEIIKPLVLGLAKLNIFKKRKAKLVIEKPFGNDYESAKELMDYLKNNIGAEGVFLVDHYLTKELVRNLITLRFANPIFNKLWNKENIKEIKIIAHEKEGIGLRGEYYDKTGAIKDMVQNHCLQLLALVTMSKPENSDYKEFVDRKLQVFDNLKLFNQWNKCINIGQYKGYLKEVGVDKNSLTETSALVKLRLDLPDWQGVPIIISTGKKYKEKVTEINVVFNNNGKCLWGEDCDKLIPNQLTINLHPDNDIVLTINSNFNPKISLPKPVKLRLGSLDPSSIAASSYENVILDILENNRLNSPSFEEILAQWKIVDEILSITNLRKNLVCYSTSTMTTT